MPNQAGIIANLRVGLAIETGMGIANLKEAQIRDQQAELANLRAGQRTVEKKSDGEYEAMLAQQEVEVLKQQLRLKDEALREKDVLIMEWMHSNEAFKKLTRQYGKKLGVSDDERKEDFANAVVDLAEEDPKFSQTKMAESKRAQLGLKK